ncbi:hypothetical protein FD723_40845 (plasmid) [Nostoc sp. C052]|uniref:hypothetical protein n=1 Tax=Nostoc sp. C052 TaxID=2576902 RepID=UPI0015C34B30|nr:hypothetical protein [Nostoc sp. C052]QLE46564.1 hypothetical protein FD723_40845 [Nostoc sp. C052]
MDATRPLKAPNTAIPSSGVTSASPQITPPIDQIMKISPDFDRRNVEKYWGLIAKEMASKGLTSKNQVIAICATICAETTTFAPIKEAGRYFEYDPFRGRGFVQLTWKEDYLAVGKALGLGDKLIRDPDMAMEPELAAKILVWEWMRGYNVSKYAEKGDFANCRSIINRGHPNKIHQTTQSGTVKFHAAVKRGLQFVTMGIDGNTIGSVPLSGDYGLGCVDTGSGGSRVLSGLNPGSQGDALAYALGIHALDNQRSHIFKAQLDVASLPQILDLDAQTTFEGKGLGEGLDGTYTVDEITFYFGRTLTADIVAYKPDPNASQPQVFLHDANTARPIGDNSPTQPIAAGEIPGKIYAAAIQARGSDTSNGPDGGKNACAFAVNKFCLLPAGLKMIGSAVPPYGVPVSVAACETALKGGRGKLITRAEAVPGDIWVQSDRHIGICATAGCTRVLSNSSSKAKFQWEDAIEKVNSFYGNSPEKIYRVLN